MAYENKETEKIAEKILAGEGVYIQLHKQKDGHYVIRTPMEVSRFAVIDCDSKNVRPRNIIAETETDKGYHYLVDKRTYCYVACNGCVNLQDSKYYNISMNKNAWDEFTHSKFTGKRRYMRIIDSSDEVCSNYVKIWNSLAQQADSLLNNSK